MVAQGWVRLARRFSVALVEAEHVGVALFFKQQIEHCVYRVAAALGGNLFKGSCQSHPRFRSVPTDEM